MKNTTSITLAMAIAIASATTHAQHRYDSSAERERIRAELQGRWAGPNDQVEGMRERARIAADSNGVGGMDSTGERPGGFEIRELQPAKPKMSDLVCYGVFYGDTRSLNVTEVESCTGVPGCTTVPLAGAVTKFSMCDVQMTIMCTAAGFSPNVEDGSICGN